MDQIKNSHKVILSHTENCSEDQIEEKLLKIKDMTAAKLFEVIDYSSKETLKNITIYPKRFQENNIEKLIKKLKSNDFGKLIRTKGYIKSDLNNYKINYVKGNLTIDETEDRSSVLVFIGSQLNEVAINQYFN